MSAALAVAVRRLPLPFGRRVELPGRGTTFVREVPGPAGAPTLLLLHGWMASGGLNWFRVFETLGREFRVLAPDLRGHGRGLRSRQPFRLTDCADDVAALLAALDAGPVVTVGYSMGGAIAQILGRRHPELVSGLVLCATASHLGSGPAGGLPVDAALGALARAAQVGERLLHLPSAPLRALGRVGTPAPTDLVQWAVAEFRRHDVRHVVEAARASGRFDARPWLPRLELPSAVVVTARDRVVPPHRQRALAATMSAATVHEVAGGHAACASTGFVEPLADACRDVAERARPSPAA
ncbi:MAG TPA: alpha/beta fold hydrolase [Acidimicrobiia bacterium]|nr:alpha/beta fold hydrolase [Acidimicrobiia bacterium]